MSHREQLTFGVFSLTSRSTSASGCKPDHICSLRDLPVLTPSRHNGCQCFAMHTLHSGVASGGHLTIGYSRVDYPLLMPFTNGGCNGASNCVESHWYPDIDSS